VGYHACPEELLPENCFVYLSRRLPEKFDKLVTPPAVLELQAVLLQSNFQADLEGGCMQIHGPHNQIRSGRRFHLPCCAVGYCQLVYVWPNAIRLASAG
jgi:hypothetical protein